MEVKDIDELIQIYNDLEKNKQVIANIDKNFFFDFTSLLIKGYEELRGNKLIDDTKCLRCGSGKPGYCEDCFQKLIAENAKLENELKGYKEANKLMHEKITYHKLW